MAARRLPWDQRTRDKIKVGVLIHLLHECAEGRLALTLDRLKAIDILLKKAVPDLMRAEIKADVTHQYVAEIPPVLDRADWEKKYGPNATLQ